MKYNLEQLAKLKSLTLTETERGLVRAHAAYLIVNTPVPQKSVQSLFQRGVYHGLRIALSSFVFFVFVGGTVSAVADNALPGDPLYTFKLNVNEEVKGLFQKTPEEKVAYGAKRVENRVKEIKTLAESKTLTKAKQATVQKALDEHIKDLSVNLNNLSTVAPNAALVATTTLEENLKANKLVIENTETADGTGKEEAILTVNGTIKEVSNQEVKIISKEIDSIASDIVATPSVTTETSLTPKTPDKKDSTTPPPTPVGP
jgi:hypothetical protein